MDSQHDEIVEWILKGAGGRGQNYEALSTKAIKEVERKERITEHSVKIRNYDIWLFIFYRVSCIISQLIRKVQ